MVYLHEPEPWTFVAKILGPPPAGGLTRVDVGAVDQAASDLGLRFPIEIRPFYHYNGSDGRIPLGGAKFDRDSGRWLIYMDATQPDHPTSSGHGFSYTLWHELGHVLDFETQAGPSATAAELHHLVHETETAQQAIKFSERVDGVHNNDEYQAIRAEYAASAPEVAAEKVAAEYGHRKLTLERKESHVEFITAVR